MAHPTTGDPITMSRLPASPALLYIHDPMCSWCWAFRPVWQQLQAQLPPGLLVRRLVGGLAPDSDVPMDPAMQAKLQSIWRAIAARVPGTEFNFDFWTRCTPRRSTYNACRAVLLARSMAEAHGTDAEEAMVNAIQTAYYLQARNPSDVGVLASLAGALGWNEDAFAAALRSPAVDAALQQELSLVQRLPIQGFPSLVLHTARGLQPIALDYLDTGTMLRPILAAWQSTAP
ncbi:MAG: DsbA family protein [Rhodoferax sp.]|uniref:DsbA family protein n=1 Tax=Rhodoferax sp. TaxID=50421 RepID=UPI002ACE83C4|nr:DsbA family protein [Rhodoferax sp.]MDZ7890523.1 DsbA family protein [Rhodoferax sp.]